MMRGAVAKLLGKSIASVRRLEEHDHLHPRVYRGVHHFDRHEVLRLQEALANGDMIMPCGLVEANVADSNALQRLESENRKLRRRLAHLEEANATTTENNRLEWDRLVKDLRAQRDELEET